MKTSQPDAHFCRRLRELREARDLTIDEFCNQYNARFDGRMNKSTVSRYENGAQEPMISTVKKLALFYGVDPSDLLGYPSRSASDGPAMSGVLASLAAALDQLDDDGQKKLLAYAEDLVASGRYVPVHGKGDAGKLA